MQQILPYLQLEKRDKQADGSGRFTKDKVKMNMLSSIAL